MFLDSEFNYVKNENDDCVLVPETTPLSNDNSCRDGARVWYERTAYRKIPYSTCEGGPRPDHGAEHVCPGLYARSTLFWLTIILLPFAFTALIAFWYYRRNGMARGYVVPFGVS
jgi:Sortilin, neurotensin receptor 3, C-terminal